MISASKESNNDFKLVTFLVDTFDKGDDDDNKDRVDDDAEGGGIVNGKYDSNERIL
jgi:hypothetical protein